MAKRALIRAGIVVGLAGLLVFVVGAAAWATTGQSGPTPPKVGDPVGGAAVPHGGYSTASNFCLQCHDVHDPAGTYSLLWKASVTATCRTCHGTLNNPANATGTRDPVGPGTIATTSSRTAYDVATPLSDHSIGSSTPPGETDITITQSDWSYGGWRFPPPPGPPADDATTPAGPGTASDTGGGLYCASCHTPHAEFGQVANASKIVTSTDGTGATQATVDWAENTIIWWEGPGATSYKQVFLHKDVNPDAWELCDLNGGALQTVAPVAGAVDTVPVGACAYAQVSDAEGQTVSLYGYKLLSAYPNHTYAQAKSWDVDRYNHDGQLWCGACHPSRVDISYGGTVHNHPTGCTACHGSPSASTGATDRDFPHTSSIGSLLSAFPDGLCVNCHTSGSLP